MISLRFVLAALALLLTLASLTVASPFASGGPGGSIGPGGPSPTNGPGHSGLASIPASATPSPFYLSSTPATPSVTPSYPPGISSIASFFGSSVPSASPLSSLPALSSVPAFSGTAASATPTQTPGCLDGAYILAIRGTTEDQGSNGLVQPLAERIYKETGGKGHSDVVKVQYPASYFPGKQATQDAYYTSVKDGVTAVEQLITAFVDQSLQNQCPTIQVVIVGFSQGANVLTDTLAGGPYVGAPRIQDMYGQYIKAACAFGDPTFKTNVEPIDEGTNKNGPRSGIFARSGDSLDFLVKNFSGRLRSYCALNDRYCADTPFNDSVHGKEIAMYGDQCVAFVKSLLTPKRKLLKPRVKDLVPKPFENLEEAMVERGISR